MATKNKTFKTLEFKTQQEINADRRRRIEDQREALNRRIADIRNQSHRYNGKKYS